MKHPYIVFWILFALIVAVVVWRWDETADRTALVLAGFFSAVAAAAVVIGVSLLLRRLRGQSPQRKSGR